MKKLPSLVVFCALQMIRDRRPSPIIGTIEEEEVDEDDEREVTLLNPLHVGKLSFSLERKCGR